MSVSKLTTCSSEQQTQPSSHWPGSHRRSGIQSSETPGGAQSGVYTQTLRRSCRPLRLKAHISCRLGMRSCQHRSLQTIVTLTGSSDEQNEDQAPHDCCRILSMIKNYTWAPALYSKSIELPYYCALAIGPVGANHWCGISTRWLNSKFRLR